MGALKNLRKKALGLVQTVITNTTYHESLKELLEVQARLSDSLPTPKGVWMSCTASKAAVSQVKDSLTDEIWVEITLAREQALETTILEHHAQLAILNEKLAHLSHWSLKQRVLVDTQLTELETVLQEMCSVAEERIQQQVAQQGDASLDSSEFAVEFALKPYLLPKAPGGFLGAPLLHPPIGAKDPLGSISETDMAKAMKLYKELLVQMTSGGGVIQKETVNKLAQMAVAPGKLPPEMLNALGLDSVLATAFSDVVEAQPEKQYKKAVDTLYTDATGPVLVSEGTYTMSGPGGWTTGLPPYNASPAEEPVSWHLAPPTLTLPAIQAEDEGLNIPLFQSSVSPISQEMVTALMQETQADYVLAPSAKVAIEKLKELGFNPVVPDA